MSTYDHGMTDALEALISAVNRLGFERARDAIHAYGDEADPDQADWHPAFIDMIDTAVGVAADASGQEGNDRWLAFGPGPGQSIRWAWRGDPDAEFAGMILRSVHRLLGNGSDATEIARLRTALAASQERGERLDEALARIATATVGDLNVATAQEALNAVKAIAHTALDTPVAQEENPDAE